MENKEITILIEGIRKLSQDAAQIADLLEQVKMPAEPAPEPEPVAIPAPESAPDKVYSLEEVRAILADKSRTGFRAEVKALLTAHGVRQLSEITDPKELAMLVKEAEVIGNG